MPSHRQDSYREARDAWAADQTLGRLVAVFYPGDELRCPGIRQLSGGKRVVCGASVSGRAIATAKTEVRVTIVSDSSLRCASCGSGLTARRILEATG